MATKKASPKWTLAEKKEHTEKVQKLVAKLKRENKLDNFTAITPEQIEEKFKRINFFLSPSIVGLSWGNLAGGNYGYNVTVYNPAPVIAENLFVHVWVGSGNVDPNIGTFLLNVDARFPRLTTQGFSIASGAYKTLPFLIEVPSTVQKTGYMGNSCLMRIEPYGTGMYLDRGCIVIEVT